MWNCLCGLQQTPEAGAVAPGTQHLDGTQTGGQHCADVNDDGQDHREQEGIGKPTVDDANAAICELFEHSTHSFCLFCSFVFSGKVFR